MNLKIEIVAPPSASHLYKINALKTQLKVLKSNGNNELIELSEGFYGKRSVVALIVSYNNIK